MNQQIHSVMMKALTHLFYVPLSSSDLRVSTVGLRKFCSQQKKNFPPSLTEKAHSGYLRVCISASCSKCARHTSPGSLPQSMNLASFSQAKEVVIVAGCSYKCHKQMLLDMWHTFILDCRLKNPGGECPRSQISGYSFRLSDLGNINIMKHWE